MANNWNNIIPGLLTGLGALGKGYINKLYNEQAGKDYQAGMQRLYEPVQTRPVDEATRTKIDLLKKAQEEIGIETPQTQINDRPTDLNALYQRTAGAEGQNKVTDFLLNLYNNPQGENYAKMLSGLYQKTIPDYEMKSFDKDKDVYLWDKNRNRYTKIQEGKTKKKERLLTGEERYITEKDEQGNDVYYRVYPKEITNEDGSVSLEQVKDKVTEKEFKKFEDKQMTYPEKLEMKNSYNLQYKMDLKDLGFLGGGSKKKKGSGKEQFDILSQDVKKDVKQYLIDSYKNLEDYKKGGEWKAYLDSENARLREIIGDENMKAIIDDFWTEGLTDPELSKMVKSVNLNLPNTQQVQENIQQQIPQQYQQFVKIKLNGQTFDMRDAGSRANLEKMILEQIIANPEIIAGLQAKLSELPPEIQEYIQSIIQSYQP